MKIATIYRRDQFDNDFWPIDAADKWWLQISVSLANLGHAVDMIINTSKHENGGMSNIRKVPYNVADFAQYDVLMTFFHAGFESLCYEGVDCHPFIVSNLGSVVGPTDSEEGVYFFGERRKRLFELQKKINKNSNIVNILTKPSKNLWEREFGQETTVLIIPTAADKVIPPPGRSPYQAYSEKIAVYIGNIYSNEQREVNLHWQTRLNSLGTQLKQRGIRLCFVGPGKTDILDRNVVTNIGVVGSHWDYQYYADVGIVLAQGQVQHNESTKIYYYLRTGLPVISETPIPNNSVIQDANLGMISKYGDDEMMAELAEAAVNQNWSKNEAAQYIADNHTWKNRSEAFDSVIRSYAEGFPRRTTRWWGITKTVRKHAFRNKRRVWRTTIVGRKYAFRFKRKAREISSKIF